MRSETLELYGREEGIDGIDEGYGIIEGENDDGGSDNEEGESFDSEGDGLKDFLEGVNKERRDTAEGEDSKIVEDLGKPRSFERVDDIKNGDIEAFDRIESSDIEGTEVWKIGE